MCTMREEYDDGNDDHSEEFLSFPRNITFNYNIAVYISKNMAAEEQEEGEATAAASATNVLSTSWVLLC